MQINFNFFKTSKNWVSSINQLNSDILQRLIAVNDGYHDYELSFDYCEDNCKGNIFNKDQDIVGTFTLAY